MVVIHLDGWIALPRGYKGVVIVLHYMKNMCDWTQVQVLRAVGNGECPTWCGLLELLRQFLKGVNKAVNVPSLSTLCSYSFFLSVFQFIYPSTFQLCIQCNFFLKKEKEKGFLSVFSWKLGMITVDSNQIIKMCNNEWVLNKLMWKKSCRSFRINIYSKGNESITQNYLQILCLSDVSPMTNP